MNKKAPIKLSINHKGQACSWPYPFDFTVRYVRADIVNELVDILEDYLILPCELAGLEERAKVALAKLEESHD